MELNILIVEDEVLIAEMIKLFLEESGHSVQEICISYDEAVKAFKEKRPDLAILDIRLYGDKSGIDFARYLGSQPEETPFIFLTSQHDKHIFNIAVDTTPYGYLTKPIRRESLWTTMETAYRLYEEKYATGSTLQVFDGNKKHKIYDNDIIYIKSEHVYSVIYMTRGRQITIRKPIRQILEDSSSQLLFHCHRSYIINTKKIASWNSKVLTMEDGAMIPVSRKQKDQLLALLTPVSKIKYG